MTWDPPPCRAMNPPAGFRVEACHKLRGSGRGILKTIASGLSEIAIRQPFCTVSPRWAVATKAISSKRKAKYFNQCIQDRAILLSYSLFTLDPKGEGSDVKFAAVLFSRWRGRACRHRAHRFECDGYSSRFRSALVSVYQRHGARFNWRHSSGSHDHPATCGNRSGPDYGFQQCGELRVCQRPAGKLHA